MQSINICHIISGDLWAGAEVMVRNLLEGFEKLENFEVTVIVLNEGTLAEKLRRSGLPIYILDETRMSFLEIYRSLNTILRNLQPTIIHSHRYKENFLAYLASKKLKNPKIICTQHGMPEAHGEHLKIKHRIIIFLNFLLLAKCFHHVVSVSHHMKNILVSEYGIGNSKTTVIHNGVEISENNSQDLKRNKFVIGSSGRLFPVKDFALMVEIASLVKQKTDKIFFQIAGEGPERPKLEALIRDHGLSDTFQLLGHLDDITSFYDDIELYINTSVHEGIPMSIIEAMVHWCPVIAPKVGGLPEIIDDGSDGYLIDKRTPEIFAEKCLCLWDNKNLRQKMSEAARKKAARKFSLAKIVLEYSEMYNKFVK